MRRHDISASHNHDLSSDYCHANPHAPSLLLERHNVTVATPSADYDHTAAAIKRVVGAGPVQIQRVDELLPSTGEPAGC
jgi:hypothetical protein